MHPIRFGWSSAPDPTGGAYNAPSDLLAGLKSLLLKGGRRREGKGMRRGKLEEGEGNGRREEGKGRGGKEEREWGRREREGRGEERNGRKGERRGREGKERGKERRGGEGHPRFLPGLTPMICRT